MIKVKEVAKKYDPIGARVYKMSCLACAVFAIILAGVTSFIERDFYGSFWQAFLTVGLFNIAVVFTVLFLFLCLPIRFFHHRRVKRAWLNDTIDNVGAGQEIEKIKKDLEEIGKRAEQFGSSIEINNNKGQIIIADGNVSGISFDASRATYTIGHVKNEKQAKALATLYGVIAQQESESQVEAEKALQALSNQIGKDETDQSKVKSAWQNLVRVAPDIEKVAEASAGVASAVGIVKGLFL